MEAQESGWDKAGLLEKVQDQCETVADELCNEADEEGWARPFEIEFIDGCGAFAELTVKEDESVWRWNSPVEVNQWKFEGEQLTATLKSGDGNSIRFYFQLKFGSADSW